MKGWMCLYLCCLRHRVYLLWDCAFLQTYLMFLLINNFTVSSVTPLFSCFVDYFWSSTWLQKSILLYCQFQKENQSDIMEGENQTALFEFIILGFSNLNELQFLLFTIFFVTYICTLGGNIFIILVTMTDRSIKEVCHRRSNWSDYYHRRAGGMSMLCAQLNWGNHQSSMRLLTGHIEPCS